MAASHAVRYQSYLARLDTFEKNSLAAREHFNFTDGYMRNANDILQRIRELSVEGANGIYSQSDMRTMGVEVNELLKEMISIANATGPDGTRLFAGDKAFTEPFRTVEGMVEGGGEAVTVRVEYRGAGTARRTEISEKDYASLDIGGGEAFWAERMQIFPQVDASSYQAPSATSIFVDGEEIRIAQGDNAASIAAKINE
jgi:flagellar hook-associated protein 3 FlgL